SKSKEKSSERQEEIARKIAESKITNAYITRATYHSERRPRGEFANSGLVAKGILALTSFAFTVVAIGAAVDVQHAGQHLAGVGLFGTRDLFWRVLRHDATHAFADLRTKINYAIRLLD